ncbi:hypothetical protein C8F01DRAFT_1192151 [Mycena amicta]|nr:hypothetical protein C8F01DRAFT_1192151 [Mycena amicta]
MSRNQLYRGYGLAIPQLLDPASCVCPYPSCGGRRLDPALTRTGPRAGLWRLECRRSTIHPYFFHHFLPNLATNNTSPPPPAAPPAPPAACCVTCKRRTSHKCPLTLCAMHCGEHRHNDLCLVHVAADYAFTFKLPATGPWTTPAEAHSAYLCAQAAQAADLARRFPLPPSTPSPSRPVKAFQIQRSSPSIASSSRTISRPSSSRLVPRRALGRLPSPSSSRSTPSLVSSSSTSSVDFIDLSNDADDEDADVIDLTNNSDEEEKGRRGRKRHALSSLESERVSKKGKGKERAW